MRKSVVIFGAYFSGKQNWVSCYMVSLGCQKAGGIFDERAEW